MTTNKRSPLPRCARVLSTICQELRQVEAEHREAMSSRQLVRVLELRLELDALAAWHEALSETLEELRVEARGLSSRRIR